MAFGLALFAYGKVPGRDVDSDPLVRGTGLVLNVPAAMGLVVRSTLSGSRMGPGAATILTAPVESVSVLVCATVSVLLCAAGSHRGPNAA